MALSRFFKTPGHQQFEYVPRHWDPKKEDLEERLERARSNNSKNPEQMKARIASGMRRGGARGYKGTQTRSIFRSNLLLLGIVIVLVAVTYLLFIEYLPYVLNNLGIEPPPAPAPPVN